MSEFHHVSVLLDESIEGLNIKPDGIYVDGTLGGAGHSSRIAALLTTGRLICVDRDDAALERQLAEQAIARRVDGILLFPVPAVSEPVRTSFASSITRTVSY